MCARERFEPVKKDIGRLLRPSSDSESGPWGLEGDHLQEVDHLMDVRYWIGLGKRLSGLRPKCLIMTCPVFASLPPSIKNLSASYKSWAALPRLYLVWALASSSSQCRLYRTVSYHKPRRVTSSWYQNSYLYNSHAHQPYPCLLPYAWSFVDLRWFHWPYPDHTRSFTSARTYRSRWNDALDAGDDSYF